MANSKAYEIAVTNGTSVDLLIGGNSTDGLYDVVVYGVPNVAGLEFSHQSGSTSGIPGTVTGSTWSLTWDSTPLYVTNNTGSTQTLYVQYTRKTSTGPSYT